MRLGHAETILLEDCDEDWRGLWEIPWRRPPETVAEAIALLAPLVAGGYLTTLEVTAWEHAHTAEAMPLDDALAIVKDERNYAPPAEGSGAFHILSITEKGKEAIPQGTFPNG